MKVLMLYPKYPDTYWSFKHALKFIKKKAAVPPLGLITVSAMLPKNWEKRLVDLNIEKLLNNDLEWADFIFISGMYVQKKSVDEILSLCENVPAKIIAGGPLFTQEYENYPQVDHFILNEAEITMPQFIADFETKQLKRIYKTAEYADLSHSPVPDYHLLKHKEYAFMNMQVSRGCPFNCDFCEITALLGHKVRMKGREQVINELEALNKINWKGPVAVVDDNFIGNKKIVKDSILPAMINWMNTNKRPFRFTAQTSINLADDKLLLEMMGKAGFNSTFIGIETPDAESLKSCHKVQNENRNLIENVKQIQAAGLQVSGGFIVGFDSDNSTVFQRQIDFIQNSGIASAMVGLLNAPKHTRLYEQMEKENRLTEDATGSNTDLTMNFVPKMNDQELLKGYQHIIKSVYNEKNYYQRVRNLLNNYKPIKTRNQEFNLSFVVAFFKSVMVLGLIDKGRFEYWKFMAWTLINRPSLFVDAVTHSVFGYHYRAVYGLRRV